MARTTPHEPAPQEAAQSDDRPLYGRIAALLLDELRAGTIPPGERLPGERHLAAYFQVSRETVRQALEVLRRSGAVSTDRRAAMPRCPPGRSRRRGHRPSRWAPGRRTRPRSTGPR
jgi:DNA-binding GntR family transcriptional regulator